MRVAVVYEHLAHYRRGVFTALDTMPSLTMTFVAGDASADGSIPSMDHTELKNVIEVRNFRLRGLLWQGGLLRYAALGEYDAIIYLGDIHYVTTWVAAAISRLRRRATYFWTIGWHRPDRGPKRWLRRMFYGIPNALMLYGNTARSIGRQSGIADARLHVIGNSHDVTMEREVSRAVATELSRLPPNLIGAVVRLNPAKRLDLVIEAASRLRADGFDIGVALIGEGPCRAQLIAQAEALGVPLYAPGALYSDSALSAVYERLSVTVLPEAAGLTVIQSLAYGVPVVTTDDAYAQMPEFEAVKVGVTGGLYAAGSMDHLVETVAHWLTRVATARDEVSQDCKNEVENNWTGTAQARRIEVALKAHSR